METMLKKELIGKAFEELEKFLKERVTQSPIHRMAYSRDWSPRESDAANLPEIVVIPKTTEEMVRITRNCLALWNSYCSIWWGHRNGGG